MKSVLSSLILAGIMSFSVSAFAVPFVIDGDLTDWGVNVADNNTSSWSGVRSDLLGYMIEDQNDRAGSSGYLGPNYGGQNYDSEFMGVAVANNKLVIGVSTGQRPDNGLRYYSPGDLLIYTDKGIYAVEMGAGAGGTGGAVVTEGANGSTYNLNSGGYTLSHSNAASEQLVGSIWSDVDLIKDPITPKTDVQFAINQGSTFHGLADFVYTSNTQTNQHAFYEMAFDLSYLNAVTIEKVFWSPSCGNDELIVELDYKTVDEPLMGLLVLFGFAACVFRKRK